MNKYFIQAIERDAAEERGFTNLTNTANELSELFIKRNNHRLAELSKDKHEAEFLILGLRMPESTNAHKICRAILDDYAAQNERGDGAKA